MLRQDQILSRTMRPLLDAAGAAQSIPRLRWPAWGLTKAARWCVAVIMSTKSLVSPATLWRRERIPLDRVWKVLTHLGTPLDMRGEPMSRIPAGERLLPHMRVDRRAILTKCGMQSASKLGPIPPCRYLGGGELPNCEWKGLARFADGTTPSGVLVGPRRLGICSSD